jgi:hypothetical protein
LEDQRSEPTRLVSNAEVVKELVHLCRDWTAKLLRYQLKTKYGIDVSEDQPPCTVHTLYRALTETLGESLALSITNRLYPETRRAEGMKRISNAR